MKKLLFIILLTLLFSCEKQNETCWTCIDKYGLVELETKTICDPVAAAYQNSKKHYKDAHGIWHNWICTPQK